jgi:hypothetical protein
VGLPVRFIVRWYPRSYCLLVVWWVGLGWRWLYLELSGPEISGQDSVRHVEQGWTWLRDRAIGRVQAIRYDRAGGSP